MSTKDWTVEVFINLKPSVLDPQGTTVLRALHSMGYSSLTSARLGKYFKLTFDPKLSRPEVEKQAKRVCEKLLVNQVIEQYRLNIIQAKKRAA